MCETVRSNARVVNSQKNETYCVEITAEVARLSACRPVSYDRRMPIPRVAVIVVRARRGRVNHATSQGADNIGRTYCDKSCDGWRAAFGPVDCPRCLREVRPC